jgi:hypothetical protein
LAALAKAMGRPMTDVVDEALEALERRAFFESFNARYHQLRHDEAVWRAVERERTTEANAVEDSSR